MTRKINTSTKAVITKKFIGCITKCGNRTRAVKIFDTFLYNLKIKFDLPPLDFLEVIIELCRPKVFIISKKVAGMSHKIPVPVSKSKSYSMAIKWFLASSRKRGAAPIVSLILDEIIDLYSNPSNQILKKRDEYHRLAKLNRPFLRYHRF